MPKFPIYWVPQRVGRPHQVGGIEGVTQVSNLLGSPASGESNSWDGEGFDGLKFPIYWVPQRVGRPNVSVTPFRSFVQFPIYWVPQRVGSLSGADLREAQLIGFPIYWVPQRVGSPPY